MTVLPHFYLEIVIYDHPLLPKGLIIYASIYNLHINLFNESSSLDPHTRGENGDAYIYARQLVSLVLELR